MANEIRKDIARLEISLASGDVAGAAKALQNLYDQKETLNPTERKETLAATAALLSIAGAAVGYSALQAGQPVAANVLAAQIQELASKNPSVYQTFGGKENFDATLKAVGATDQKFQSSGGIFFHLGSSPAETAEAFTRIHVEQYRQNARPSLPALVAEHFNEIGLSPDSPHYKAGILAATRAEVALVATPEYHNVNHYADVTAQVAELVKRNNQLAERSAPGAQRLTVEEMADTITAAVSHDIDHPGGKNALPGQKPGEFDPFRLEEKSFKAIEPLLKEAGLSAKAVDDIHAMILTTSPDGPHGVLKAVARAQQEGRPVEWDKIDPQNKFPGLRVLADDPKLTARAAILEDADLGGSAFEGLRSNVTMSENLTNEVQARNYRNQKGDLEDFRGDRAREGFSQFVVGEGPASAAAQDALGKNYTDMRKATQDALASGKPSGIAPQTTAASEIPGPNVGAAERLAARTYVALKSKISLDKELVEAVRMHDKGKVDFLLAGGVPVEGYKGVHNAIGTAVSTGDLEMAKFMKSRGGDPNYLGGVEGGGVTNYGLNGAVSRGNLGMIQFLLEDMKEKDPLAKPLNDVLDSSFKMLAGNLGTDIDKPTANAAQVLIYLRDQGAKPAAGQLDILIRMKEEQERDPRGFETRRGKNFFPENFPSSADIKKMAAVAPPIPTMERKTAPLPREQKIPAILTETVKGGLYSKVETGANVAGLALGIAATYDAIKRGSGKEAALDATGVGLNALGLAAQASPAIAQKIAPLAKNLPYVGGVIAAGSGALEINGAQGRLIETNADGTHSLGQKGEKSVEVVITAGTGVATAVAGVAVLPATILAIDSTIIVKAGTATYDAAKIDNNLHRILTQESAPLKSAGARVENSGAPSITNYARLIDVALDQAGGSRSDKAFQDLKNANYSDPAKLKTLENFLNGKVAEQQKILDANKSVLPYWARLIDKDSAGKYIDAEANIAPLQGALKDLADYKQKLEAYKEITSKAAPAPTGAAEHQHPLGWSNQSQEKAVQKTPAAVQSLAKAETAPPAAKTPAPASAQPPQFSEFATSLAQDNLVSGAEGNRMAQSAMNDQISALVQSQGQGGDMLTASAQPGPNGPVQAPANSRPIVYGADPAMAPERAPASAASPVFAQPSIKSSMGI